MSFVRNDTQFLPALESCQRERGDEFTFDNQNVILEKYLTHPRRIKMQMMAYMHGNVGYLHERDCSFVKMLSKKY
jgi:3-methylcrotonyl-CoA carboxylase alpha subunit